MSAPPEFGTRLDGVVYRDRPGAYAVIISAEGCVALIEARKNRFFLPGGGLEPNERPEEGLAREILEECGWEAEILRFIGSATQFLAAEGEGHFEIRARYYRARLVRQVAIAAISWLARDDAIAALARESDAWAVREEEASVRSPV